MSPPLFVVVAMLGFCAVGSGCLGAGRTTAASHPASASAPSTALPVVARAITQEDEAVAPAGAATHAHHHHHHATPPPATSPSEHTHD